jgi:hypothetical protein
MMRTLLVLLLAVLVAWAANPAYISVEVDSLGAPVYLDAVTVPMDTSPAAQPGRNQR